MDGWIYGKEICPTTGTPHIQGYVEFKKKCRPIETLGSREIHWLSCEANRAANVSYCSKDGDYRSSGKGYRPAEVVRTIREEQFYPWQTDLVGILRGQPDERTIYWFYEGQGGVGKSSFCKWACVHMDALVLSGKASDMKNAIVNWHEKKGYYPEIIILDVPRTSREYLSYTGIEEVKNGCFCSGKYESCMVVMNCPHVVVFANHEPNYEAMSMDRWDVRHLE